MPTRVGASNFVRDSVEITAMERYIREKRRAADQLRHHACVSGGVCAHGGKISGAQPLFCPGSRSTAAETIFSSA